MKLLIDRYIFKEWLKILCVTMMLVLGILMLEDMYRNLKTFLDRGADVNMLLLYYGHVVPNCLCTVLPISFFISVLYLLNDMQSHNEVIALRASGMTIFQITRSLWIAALILMLFMGVFNAYVLPYASDQMQNILQKIEYDYQIKQGGSREQLGLQWHLCLHNERAGHLWHIRTFSLYTMEGDHVTLSFMKNGHEIERIEANKIAYETGKWKFYKGKRWLFSQEASMPKRFFPFESWEFECEETPLLMSYLYKPIKYLGAGELKRIISFIPEDNPRFLEHRIKYYSIISSPLICLMVILLAIPFSLSGVRTNPMVGVSKAAGLFFVYYMVGSVGKMLGIQNTFSPLIAAWFPNLFMLILGAGLYRKLAPK